MVYLLEIDINLPKSTQAHQHRHPLYTFPRQGFTFCFMFSQIIPNHPKSSQITPKSSQTIQNHPKIIPNHRKSTPAHQHRHPLYTFSRRGSIFCFMFSQLELTKDHVLHHKSSVLSHLADVFHLLHVFLVLHVLPNYTMFSHPGWQDGTTCRAMFPDMKKRMN